MDLFNDNSVCELSNEQRAFLNERWGSWTEGLTDPNERLGGMTKRSSHPGKRDSDLLEYKEVRVQQLLELAHRGMIMEHNQRRILQGLPMLGGGNNLEEASLVAAVDPFTTTAFPMIRRVYPRLLAFDLVSIQPIAQPTAKIFFMDFKRTTGGTRLDAKADFDKTYANASEGSTPKQVEFAITDTDVSAVSKKLVAVWSIEAEQDLFSYHKLSAMQELMTSMADEMVREIDKFILNDLLAGATAGNVTFVTTPTDGLDEINLRAYNRRLYDKIIDAQNLVNKKRYRKANWVVGGIDAIAYLEKLEDFKISPEATDNNFTGQRHYLGQLNRRFDVYIDPWGFDTDTDTTMKLLVGYKGTEWLETGYVFAPHQPLYVTPLYHDPVEFKPRRGMMTRYATKLVNGDFYATVSLQPEA
jgi:hypothetical protein